MMEIEVDEFHALQEQICNLQDCCSDWEKHALDYKAENIALSGELERTRKALDVATDFIRFVNTSRHADGALAAMAICKLNKITSITKQEE